MDEIQEPSRWTNDSPKTIIPDSHKESDFLMTAPSAKEPYSAPSANSQEGGGFSLDWLTMYRSIETKFWTDEKVKTFPFSTKAILLYLITNPHTHLSGIYYLPRVLMQHETKATDQELTDGLALLESGGVIKYDSSSEVVWIVNMLSYQGQGSKINSATESQLEKLHNCCLIKEFLTYYQDRNIQYRYPIDGVSNSPVTVTDTVSISKKEVVKEKTEQPHQTIINRYLALSGTPREGLSQAQITGAYKRHSRSALALITEAGGLDHAVNALEVAAAYFTKKRLTWTLDTIAKHLPKLEGYRHELLAERNGLNRHQLDQLDKLATWFTAKTQSRNPDQKPPVIVQSLPHVSV